MNKKSEHILTSVAARTGWQDCTWLKIFRWLIKTKCFSSACILLAITDSSDYQRLFRSYSFKKCYTSPWTDAIVYDRYLYAPDPLWWPYFWHPWLWAFRVTPHTIFRVKGSGCSDLLRNPLPEHFRGLAAWSADVHACWPGKQDS